MGTFEVLEQAKNEELEVNVGSDGGVTFSGPNNAKVRKLIATIRANEKAFVSAIKNGSGCTTNQEPQASAPTIDADSGNDTTNVEPVELQGLADVLWLCAPPLELVSALQSQESRRPLPDDTTEWLRMWEAIRAGDQLPRLDRLADVPLKALTVNKVVARELPPDEDPFIGESQQKVLADVNSLDDVKEVSF